MFSATSLGLGIEPVPTWSQLARSVHHTHEKGCSFWPTPTARDADRGGLSEEVAVQTLTHRMNGRGLNLTEALGGPTNPTWVEWLMGFPEGWTDVEP